VSAPLDDQEKTILGWPASDAVEPEPDCPHQWEMNCVMCGRKGQVVMSIQPKVELPPLELPRDD
jgi:hypothetical protein